MLNCYIAKLQIKLWCESFRTILQIANRLTKSIYIDFSSAFTFALACNRRTPPSRPTNKDGSLPSFVSIFAKASVIKENYRGRRELRGNCYAKNREGPQRTAEGKQRMH